MKGFEDFDLTTWADEGLTTRMLATASNVFKTKVAKSLKNLALGATVAAAISFGPTAVRASAVPVTPAEQVVSSPAVSAHSEVPPGYWAETMQNIKKMQAVVESDSADPEPFL